MSKLKTATLVKRRYNERLKGFNEALAVSQGAVRAHSGRLFEDMVVDVSDSVGALAIKGDDDMLHPVIGDHTKNLQVDKHIFRNGTRHTFVECKTYLDASFLTRAVLNFMEINTTLDNADVEFGILAGQNAVADDTLDYYIALLKHYTGKTMRVWFVNDVKKRVSSKPIAEERFGLDMAEVQSFIDFLSE